MRRIQGIKLFPFFFQPQIPRSNLRCLSPSQRLMCFSSLMESMPSSGRSKTLTFQEARFRRNADWWVKCHRVYLSGGGSSCWAANVVAFPLWKHPCYIPPPSGGMAAPFASGGFLRRRRGAAASWWGSGSAPAWFHSVVADPGGAHKLQEAAWELKMLPEALSGRGGIQGHKSPCGFSGVMSPQASSTIGGRMTLNTSLRWCFFAKC